MIKGITKKEIFISLGYLLIIIISLYGYFITETRREVQEFGCIKKAKIERISSKRNGSIDVSINDTIYDAGDYLSIYNCSIGDSINVYHLKNIQYVVPKIRGSFLGYLILEITSFSIGVIFLIISLSLIVTRLRKDKSNL